MNLFYLNHDPKIAAANHYDKHKVKMILEAAQMLCTAHHALGEQHGYDTSYVPYKKAHLNHPSTVWVRSSAEHYVWTCDYMIALSNEYTKRYNKIHMSVHKLSNILYNLPDHIPHNGFVEPPQCMPDEYKVENDAVSAYWNYYENEKHTVRNAREPLITRP